MTNSYTPEYEEKEAKLMAQYEQHDMFYFGWNAMQKRKQLEEDFEEASSYFGE